MEDANTGDVSAKLHYKSPYYWHMFMCISVAKRRNCKERTFLLRRDFGSFLSFFSR